MKERWNRNRTNNSFSFSGRIVSKNVVNEKRKNRTTSESNTDNNVKINISI